MVLAATLVGTWEVFGLAGARGYQPHRVGGLIAAAVVAVSFYDERVPIAAALAVVVGLPLLLGLLRADLGERAIGNVATTQLAALLLSVPLGFLTRMRLLEEELSIRGDLVLLLFFAMWGADGAAYYVGRALGRHKLAPRVSPKKTWEGAAGGVLGAIALALVYRSWLWGGDLRIGFGATLAVAVTVALFGPAGDLAESVLKRSAGVKDSGVLFPGHGGILDRLDSLLLTAPVLYYYYRLAL